MQVGTKKSFGHFGQVIQAKKLAKAQSVTVEQTFTGGLDVLQINSVQVTVFDGESTDTATSGPVTASSSSNSMR